MGKATSTIKEVRFIIESELTQVYIFSEANGDAPIGVQGWHHETFPASKSLMDIIPIMANNYLLWPLDAPK